MRIMHPSILRHCSSGIRLIHSSPPLWSEAVHAWRVVVVHVPWSCIIYEFLILLLQSAAPCPAGLSLYALCLASKPVNWLVVTRFIFTCPPCTLLQLISFCNISSPSKLASAQSITHLPLSEQDSRHLATTSKRHVSHLAVSRYPIPTHSRTVRRQPGPRSRSRKKKTSFRAFLIYWTTARISARDSKVACLGNLLHLLRLPLQSQWGNLNPLPSPSVGTYLHLYLLRTLTVIFQSPRRCTSFPSKQPSTTATSDLDRPRVSIRTTSPTPRAILHLHRGYHLEPQR